MHALAWNDYLCPWAYLGRDRTRLMRDLGVEITQLPYELHPEVPPEGIEIRAGGRLSGVLDIIEAECDDLHLPFARPGRTPNTRHVLETSETVRRHFPEAFAALDESLARAHWVEGLDLGDRQLVAELVRAAGADAVEVGELVSDGVGTTALRESMNRAREVGVTATPAWWVDQALLIPGAQPRETVERWVRRLIAHSAA